MNRFLTGVVILAILFFAGCSSGLVPVEGTVAFDDGTPVGAGMVVVEMAVTGDEKPSSANGNILPDGSFELTTLKPNDGVPAGRYKVAVLSPPLSDEQAGRGEKPLVDAKYSQFETSGLEIEVRPDRNQFALTVTKPRASRKK